MTSSSPSNRQAGTDIPVEKAAVAELPMPPVPSLTATPPIPAESYELRILQSLRRIIRAIETHSQALVQNHHVTGPQLACLLAVREHGALTTCKLAHAVFLSPSTVVGIVDRLAEKGLVTRERGQRDRRQVLVALTEAGLRLVERAPSPLQETLSAGLRELPALEQVSITLALEKVVDLMNARGIDASPLLETGSLAAPVPRSEKPPLP